MRKIFVAIALLGVSAGVFAQESGLDRRAAVEEKYGVKDAEVKFDTRAEMLADPSRMAAEYCDYPFGNPAITPAPKGYKPFYISHIGRHGARYAISDNVYEKARDFLEDAHQKGRLTEKGEDLYARYEAFYPLAAHRGGDLTRKGQEQLRGIAEVMYKDFPEVFKGKTHAEVLCTPVTRTLMSMVSFLDELRTHDTDIEYTVDAGRMFYPILEPNKSISPIKVKVPLPDAVNRSAEKFMAERIDAKSFCDKFFVDTDYVEEAYGMWKFESDFRNIVSDATCLPEGTTDETFGDVFTFEEMFATWEVRNYNGYVYMGRTPLSDNRNCINNAAILKSMIEAADKDLASGKVQLSLRFSHDTAVLPLVSFMRLNNFGAVVEDPNEVKNYWRGDFITMAANLQLIFYRSKKSPDILLKVLYNGEEASLPLHEVAPSFYSWNDFRTFYLNLIEESNK